MNFIFTELDAFLQTKGRSMILNGITAGITFGVLKLSLSRFATPDEILSWSTALTGAIVTGIVHFVDLHIGNANVAITGPAATPQTAAQPSQPTQPVAPAAAAPASSTPSQPPSVSQ